MLIFQGTFCDYYNLFLNSYNSEFGSFLFLEFDTFFPFIGPLLA